MTHAIPLQNNIVHLRKDVELMTQSIRIPKNISLSTYPQAHIPKNQVNPNVTLRIPLQGESLQGLDTALHIALFVDVLLVVATVNPFIYACLLFCEINECRQIPKLKGTFEFASLKYHNIFNFIDGMDI